MSMDIQVVLKLNQDFSVFSPPMSTDTRKIIPEFNIEINMAVTTHCIFAGCL